jgi:hypothetical protein
MKWPCRLMGLLSLALVLVLGPASVHADLTMSLDNLTGPTAGQGTFEVLLTNTVSTVGQSFDVASFSFQLMLPSASGVQFTSATSATASHPYIFAGTGGASVDPNFTLSLDSFPNTGFAGSDTEFTFASITVDPGTTFGLGLISYQVGANAPAGDVAIAFVALGTSLTDAVGAPIAFATDDRNGVIPISGSAVPEPSSLLVALCGLGAGHVMCVRSRRSPQGDRPWRPRSAERGTGCAG